MVSVYIIIMDNERPIFRFYHETVTSMCKKDNLTRNTHRTDFVGYGSSNKCFCAKDQYVVGRNDQYILLQSRMSQLEDLVKKLMMVQKDNFFLNEFPEEVDHLQYFDIDARICDELLDDIRTALEELTTGDEIKVLRNNVSGKIHLIMGVPAETYRESHRKKAIGQWIRDYLYDFTAKDYYTSAEWAKIFDAAAPGIRSAYSVKIRAGELEPGKGWYEPLNAPVNSTQAQKIATVLEYSIYAKPTARWTRETLDYFEEAEIEYEERTTENYLPKPDLNSAGEIAFSRKCYKPTTGLINDFIKLLDNKWTERPYWYALLKHVKTISTLIADFDHSFFLHKWSKTGNSYNAAGNDSQWRRSAIHESPAVSLTWLRNLASQALKPDPDLERGDLGMAELFVNKAGGRIKMSGGSWYLWNKEESLWLERESSWIGNEVSRVLESIIEPFVSKLSSVKTLDLSKLASKWSAIRERILGYRAAMDIVKKATPMLTDFAFVDQCNNYPDLLPIQNGQVVNLRTGEVTQRGMDTFFTFECPVSVDNNPKNAAIVKAFMLDICVGDLDMLNYLQACLGYCITGRVDEKAVFIWYGPEGNNGKSTIMNLMKKILASYCKSASKALFIKSGFDNHLSPEREVLKNTRLALFSETAVNDSLNDEVLKVASGDDPIRVNPKYRDEYEFISYAKLLIASNHKPQINIGDKAMVQRMRFMPFDAKFVVNPSEAFERKIDKELVRKIETTLLSALFTWILEGTVKWYKTGLPPTPTVMEKATVQFMADNDDIGDYLSAHWHSGNGEIQISDLYVDYSNHCDRLRVKPKNIKIFSMQVEKCYAKVRRNTGMFFTGIANKRAFNNLFSDEAVPMAMEDDDPLSGIE